MTPKLNKVIRLDSLPLNQTFFTPEGYLMDRPILTSTGIFEYHNPDGSVRRELRLPDEVFAAESLKSYKGRPIIITHDAGLVDKDNVHEHQIGTILTDGYRSGEDVRAEIIIHDTDEMKSCGLKELSLGYNLDLDETPGEWNGQPYDAIQRNIRINHLALVREARAGEQARLNIDSRDHNKTLKGGKIMRNPTKKTHRGDGVLTPEELAKAIEEYKARRAAAAANGDEGEEPATAEVAVENPEATTATDGEETPAEPAVDTSAPVEEQVAAVKDRKDRRDEEGTPETVEEATEVIAKQDEDMSILFDIIDTLLAQQAFDNAEEKPAEEKAVAADEGEETPAETPAEEPAKTDSEDPAKEEPAAKKEAAMNADSIDAIVRQRIQIGMVGRSLNMDGLENMSIRDAKIAIVNAVRPGMRLDGKSATYINAAYDCALADVKARSNNSVASQKQQMFNADSRANVATGENADAARARMIERMKNDK